ncbi:uncharacterized protein JCM6883_006596 [Sporobolomyces salmoneus]|uniref:uncharacterized protein n=1 Tax=Sporobolomyces salmoneus TaxID=183962 RepID=UPI0031801425
MHDPPTSKEAADNEGIPHSESESIPPSPQLSFPRNYLHVLCQFLILLALLPYHATLYSLFPSKRPRSSWTLLDTVFLQAVRRYLAMMDTAGFKISGRDVFAEPRKSALSMWLCGCRFEWFEETVDPELYKGSVADDEVGGVEMRSKVGVFSWYKKDHSGKIMGESRKLNKDLENSSPQAEDQGLVGIFFHGGAFTHTTAHPKAQSTTMPLTLFKREKRFTSMHSVEFRLLPEFPFPAQLQDAITVYIALLKRGVKSENIVLIGDSSGANIALSLARWIRDTLQAGKGSEEEVAERDGKSIRWKLGDPAGLILFSPWIDPSHSFLDSTPETYRPRSNSCDYIFEAGPFRHHLVHNLLGPKRPRSFVLSPYLSPGRVDLPLNTFRNHPAKAFISYGTGERGQAECERLIEYLRRDGVQGVEVVKTEDTVHDVLLLGFWKRQQREEIWRGALDFLGRIPVKAGE